MSSPRAAFDAPASRRLVLVGPFPPPWGGIAVHVAALQRLAGREGIDAEVLDIGAGRDERGEGGEVRSAGSPPRFLSELARIRAGDAAVHVHVPGNNPKAWAVALAVARARPGGLLTIHSGLAPSLLARSLPSRLMAKAACARYAAVLCANAAIAESLQGCGAPAEKLRVLPAFLPGGIRPGEAPAAAIAARARHPILLCAALAPGAHYGEAVLLDGLSLLARQLPGVGCVVFGPGTRSRELREGIRQRGLQTRVTALGSLEQDVALAVMALSDLFVRPTLADGDSISVREALSLGLRVVASDVGHRPAGVSLFAAGDPAELAARAEIALRADKPSRDGGASEIEAELLAAWAAIGLRPLSLQQGDFHDPSASSRSGP